MLTWRYMNRSSTLLCRITSGAHTFQAGSPPLLYLNLLSSSSSTSSRLQIPWRMEVVQRQCCRIQQAPIDTWGHLIEEKYCTSSNLYAAGGSAGGLLMGAIINMNPNLYNGVIAHVPFVDVITTMLDELNWEDFSTSDMYVQGLPITQEMFESFKKYYLYWYDSKVELGKQIHYLKSAVLDLKTNNIPFLMSPNTLLFLQDKGENAHYWERLFDFIPGVNRIQGVASMLREHDEEIKGWVDYSRNPGCSLNYHISPMAQKYYSVSYTHLTLPTKP